MVATAGRGGVACRGYGAKIDPDTVYECWQAFAADGIPGVIATGTRLRGDDDIVKTHPHWFVTAGSPPHEWQSELGTTEPPPPAPDPSFDVKLTVEPRPLEGVVEATRDVTVLLDHGAVSLATGGLPGRSITYPKGTRFQGDSELTQARQEAEVTRGAGGAAQHTTPMQNRAVDISLSNASPPGWCLKW